MTGSDRYETINEFVIAGESGFLRVEGPFNAEKEGKLWTVLIPTDEEDVSAVGGLTLDWLRESEGMAAVVIADGRAVGGGIVKIAWQPDGERNFHVVIDQYARGLNTGSEQP